MVYSNTSFPSRSMNSKHQVMPSTYLQREPRKGHKKSRRGCYECKRRKIKCQETHPKCGNCSRLSLCCRYFPEVAAMATQNSRPQQPFSSLQIANVFSLTDMRLFHHFLVAAFPHLPVRCDEIWLSYITPIGHQYEYLMHAMLALSASHLTKLGLSCLILPAQTHRLAAIKGLNDALCQPLCTSEEGDAVIGTCYALLMQSWYMDDGLQASLVLTRSCERTTQWVREQNLKSILAGDDEGTRLATMRSRFKDAPVFDSGFIEKAVRSLEILEPICTQEFEINVFNGLKCSYTALYLSPLDAYNAYVKIDALLNDLDHESLLKLLDTSNETSQLLLAHLIALHLLMRPLSCRERKQYTVSMYGIRMKMWIPTIYNGLSEERRWLLDGPMWIAGLHNEGKLERKSLISGADDIK